MSRSQISTELMIDNFCQSILILFHSGSHPGSTILLVFIEPVPTNFRNRILKTFLTLFNFDFRSNAKGKTNRRKSVRDDAYMIHPAPSGGDGHERILYRCLDFQDVDRDVLYRRLH